MNEAAPSGARAKQKPRRNVLAMANFIDLSKDWDGALRLNLLSEQAEIAFPFPHLTPTAARQWRPLTDADILEAMVYFQANGFPNATKGAVSDALMIVARRRAFHPVRNYLNRLKWDGTPRVSQLLVSYFNAALPNDQGNERDRLLSYYEHISACWMVSAVARVTEPGCKVDHTLILLGEQGFNKSQALRALCHDPAWFCDNISANLIDRDTKESLRGKWIVELSEIPHLSKEVELVKAFFTRQIDRYRAAYGRLSEDHARQQVFAGTGNDVEFIDTSGNRRFWPVEITAPIDVAAIVRDCDQLWAEAVHLFRGGYQWWLPPNIEAIARERQDAFAESDVLEDKINDWLSGTLNPGQPKPSIPFTMATVTLAIFGLADFALVKKADQMRLAACLKRLRFRRRLRRVNGQRAWWWWRR
jgi:predicted P-loop ATPase